MHPILVVIPAAILLLGPGAWVAHLLKKHDERDLGLDLTARELARQLLDRQQLQVVRVESTDIGDHYDHQARAVRLARSRIDRKTLTALTTAAHEVAHAMQDAADYGPFVWRTHLAKVSQVVGQAGSVVLVTAPMLSLIRHRPLPLYTMSSTVTAILVTGLATQLAALPTEIDASFNRALPMLQDGYIDQHQVNNARVILAACSITYIAASMVSMLNFWPWFGARLPVLRRLPANRNALVPDGARPQPSMALRPSETAVGRSRRNALEPIVRCIAKPIIRAWFQLSGKF